MISLAPIKFAEVLSQDGGPIQKVEYSEGLLMGRPCMHAVAYLRNDLLPANCRAKMVVRQPDGAGTHQSAQVASHMAISEAIERWAVYHCRAYRDEVECGIDLDGSSNGFAAFPGLFKSQARKAAFQESIERHCLICWWEGLLGHTHLPDPQPEVRAIQINNPFSSHTVVLIWGRRSGQYAFAFGAGRSVNHAIWRASVELDRTQKILRGLIKEAENSDFESSANVLERRIEYFSRKQGMLHFLDRLERSVVTDVPSLKLLFDGEVKGPWSHYATVWRTVAEVPTRTYLSDAADYFFW